MRQQTSRRGFVPPFMLALAASAALVACGGGGNNGFSFIPTPGSPANPGNPQADATYKAEIRRTAMGVPHIKADNFAGVGYGYGYAQAEDNLCTMADSFLTYRGERSQYLGADAQLVASSTIARPKNIDSDFFHRHVISADVLKKMIDAQPDNLKKMVEGFTAGYNRYVREARAGGSAHAACRTEAWVQPITTDDIYRRMYAANLAGGYSNFLTAIATAVAPEPNGPQKLSARSHVRKLGVQHAALNIGELPMQVGGHEGVGSNMIGFGTAATGDKSPLLFGNPHWYWRGPDRFYQAQLTIPGQLNISGTSFLGIPVILIGFNDNIAWSHTVSTARRFGIYELQLASGDPTSYMRDGKAVKMQADAITIKVKAATGEMTQVTRTLYKSEYGPMLNLNAANSMLPPWGQATAYAMRDINGENYRTFRNWLRWNQAKSLDEFIAIQREEAAIPWVNTVAVGRGSDKAWYADIGAVPNVSADQMASCSSQSQVANALRGSSPRVPILDGSRSACDWQTDADSVQKGAIGPSRMPSLMRDDYVANMNDSYWLANPKVPLTGYPDIMGAARTEAVSFRTRMGNLLAQGRIDGTDSYGAKGATVDTVKRMVLNSRVLTAEVFKNEALDIVCALPATFAVNGDLQAKETFTPARNVDTTAACNALRSWDNTGVTASRGAHLWDEFWNRALLPSSAIYTTPFDPDAPIQTPRGLKTDPTTAQNLRQAFGAAVLRVEASGYAVDAQRGDYLFATRGGKKIPLYGGCGGPGYFTISCSDNRLDKGGYTMDKDPNGNSYMQIVRFPEGGVEAHTFLTFSLSDDPASEHNGDYTRAYSAGQWLKVPFSESEIKADAALRSTSINE
ncbi:MULTISPECIES: penicillin acylase family protein [Variovorax]|jgi:acyl-homoserine-lactone acylase|uniref:penicillin acylase family protein n=1 Tax=Variovorax TaxID=34072 RepID=UPI00086B8D6C|nr:MULTISPECIES: penicillin acylase family protein [Variovorax]ODU16703.1 MAG: acylase [Variovorax sp. SCN 67-85]ODV24677.1 MAG: acylase [Variovorax sp. SCN 67-20]OJZ15429.1 MAG: acylase [Variovorax sp. 67-131]UKI07845.1 penicillin acylase family protein [Variovorax paradoxus]